MKIFFLSGMYPTPTTPHGGIFITKRLKYLKSKVNLDLYALAIVDTKLLNLIKKSLGMNINPNNKLGELILLEEIQMNYKVIKVYEGVIDKILNKITSGNHSVKKIEKKVLLVAKTSDFDLFHAHWTFPHGVVIDRISSKLNRPSIITAHGSDINVLMDNKYYKQMIVNSLNNVNIVEFVSEALYKRAKKYGFKNLYSIVPNGIEVSNTNFINCKNETKKVIGFVGNLIHIKGADLLFEIISGIDKAMPGVIEFKIIGDGDFKSTLEKKLEKLNVEFKGRIPHHEVLEEMRKMHLLLLPSRNEGWPCVVLEAHSEGVIVIGSDRGGIPEAIGNPELIVNMDKDFIDNYIDKVVAYLSNEININTISLRDRANQYNWEALSERTINNYKEILRGL